MGKILRNAQEVPKPAVLTRSLVAMSIAALSSLPSLAQESPTETVVIQVSPEAVQVVPAPPPEQQQTKPATPAGKTPEEKRLEELLKLKIERTPAGILKAKTKLKEGAPKDNPVETFRLNLVAGHWKEAGTFLKSLPEKDAVKVYEFVLKELDKVPAANPGQQQQQSGLAPTPTLQAEEIADLADIAPTPLNEGQIKLLASLLKRIFAANAFVDSLVQRLEQGNSQIGGKDPAKRELAALLLIETSRNLKALKFLPPLGPGQETKSLGLTEKHVRAGFHMGRQEQKPEAILQAWQLNQMMLAAPNCPPEVKERAWRRYADIVRFLPPDLSAQELKKTFQQQPDNGLTLLKEISTQIGDDRSNRNTTVRKENLGMQRNAVEALLPVAARRAEWQPALDLFTLNWVEEADYAKRLHTPPRPQGMQYDPYGNPIYYGNQPQPAQQSNPNQLPPIPLAEVLTTAPGEEWLKAIDPSLRSRVLTVMAESYLKLEEDEKAVPYIEKLAALEPKETLRLSNELLRVWANTHDPMRASGQRRSSVMTSSGMVYYNYSQQQAIPLTRALQQRNMEELSALLQRLRVLPIQPLDNAAVVAAFTAAHSPAEVFREESIKLAFGEVAQIKPETLAELLQTMRQRLAGQWRKPNVQQQAKTQRTDAQIDAEVLNGYELLSGLVQKGLERQPDDWRLNLVQAAMWFDWAEFQYGKKVDLAIYVEKREHSFAAFQRAAELYAAKVPSLEQKEETPLVYQQWLNANLGASDLALVTRQQEPSEKNLERIRNAILSLPGAAAQRHLDALAKAIASGTDSLPAHLKAGYMRAALSIVNDRPDAEKIRDLVAYYDGLLREIELSVHVDGDATVGHDRPFGVFLTVHHTAELERENAGGFSKYLRNQSQMPYYYNPYGIAPIDHKDELEKQMREKFSEGFEILSITFHDEKVQSRGYGRQGWRETPLVYALLKAKDGSVDRIPSLRLDVDFVDKYGPVVLPIQSPVQLIDARVAAAPARPVKGMEITHTLDDRTAKEGKITLEIKATANGLIPKLDELFDFNPAGFKIDELTDSGPAIQRLSSEGEELAAVSERNWVVKLSHEPSSTGAAAFQFPKPKAGDLKVAYKRYQDADLVEVAPDIALAGMPLNPNRMWPWMLLGTVVVVTAVVVPMRLRRQSAPTAAGVTYSVPSTVTPFTTLQLLRQMDADGHLALSGDQRAELSQNIAQVESYYFAPSRKETEAPDLDAIAKTWVDRAGAVRG